MTVKANATIDLNALKVAGEPNKYITKITGDGIKVHDSQNQTSNYIQITSTAIDVYKEANSVASFGETVNIGKYKEYGDKKIVIGPSGFKIMLVNSSRTEGSTTIITEETVLAEIATTNLSTDLFSTYYSFGRRKEGSNIGADSIAEGVFVTASGITSHAEGTATSAIGNYSHTEGNGVSAIGDFSHAEGNATIASGHGSHTQNIGTIALEDYQTVIGKYNAATVSGQGTASSPYTYSNVGNYAFIIGNGTNNTTATRSNALTVDWNGNVNIASGAKYKINGTALAASDVSAVSTSDVSTTGGANKVIKSNSSGNVIITGNLTLGGHTTSIGSTLTATNSAQKSISADGSTTLATLSNLPIGTWVIECNIRFSNTANGIRRGGLLASGSSLGTSNMDFQIGAATTAAFVKQTFTKVITTTAIIDVGLT